MARKGMLEVDSEDKDNKNLESLNITGSNDNELVSPICKPVKASTPVSILIESLVKNLCSIYEPDETKATKIYNLICSKLFEMKLIDESYSMREFEGMRNQYQRALYHLVTSAIGENPVPLLQSFWLSNDVTSDWSHYYREFDEIEYIAGGGFGQVYRVKHKLDGTEYAVKKIFIRSEGIKAVRNYLSEVKTFASLNHSHIVQYKAAWLELGAATSKNAIVDHGDSEMLCSTEYESENTPSKIDSHIDTYIYPQAVSDTETSFPDNKYGDTDTDFEVDFENSIVFHQISQSSDGILDIDGKMIHKCNRIKRSSISEGGNAICKIEEIHDLHIQAKTNSKWATLYIQMALCQSTLKQWLEKRNEALRYSCTSNSALVPCILSQVQTDTVMEILKQLLKGIQYIHSKNIVHHDIKPSNIFIQIENGRLVVQLGDFGLACPLQSARHSLAFGTKLYAAPEQLLGKCNPKSDMYSIGIVLLELVETFSTDMERIRCISDLRKGNIPAHLSLQHPLLSAIICQLVTNNPNKRPNATELLQRINSNVGESELVQKLQAQIAEKDKEIGRLKEMLRNAGFERI